MSLNTFTYLRAHSHIFLFYVGKRRVGGGVSIERDMAREISGLPSNRSTGNMAATTAAVKENV